MSLQIGIPLPVIRVKMNYGNETKRGKMNFFTFENFFRYVDVKFVNVLNLHLHGITETL